MKASKGRNATRAQRLEAIHRSKGIEHARYVRDELGWRWEPGVMIWTWRHGWVGWTVAAGSFLAAVVAFASDLRELLR